MPLLRRTHDHHRDLRARRPAARPAAPAQDWNLMMVRSQNPNAARPCRRFSTGHGAVLPNPAPRRPRQRQSMKKAGVSALYDHRLAAVARSICSPYPQKPSPDPQIPIGRAAVAEHVPRFPPRDPEAARYGGPTTLNNSSTPRHYAQVCRSSISSSSNLKTPAAHARASLEVTEFRAHGPAWRRARAGHLSIFKPISR